MAAEVMGYTTNRVHAAGGGKKGYSEVGLGRVPEEHVIRRVWNPSFLA
jgi:hypothetical protein